MLKRCLCVAALLLSLVRCSWSAEPVALDAYLKMVREQNQALQSGVRSVEAAYYGVMASVSYQRPSLGISASGSYLTAREQMAVKDTDISAYQVNLALTHRFDISGSYTLDERQQVLSYEVSRANFDEDVNSLLAMAENTYWNAVLARENVVLQKDVLRQRMENNRVTEEKYVQQLVPKLDLVRSEAQVVAAESLVKEAEATYRNLLANMTMLAGGVDVIPINDPLVVPTISNLFSVGMEQALRYRPSLRASRLSLERTKVLKKLTAKGKSPTLSAAVTWVPLSDPWNSSSPQKRELAATLSLNVPILDGNETKYSVLNADRTVQAADALLHYLENSIKTDLAVAMNDWAAASAIETDKKRQVERSDEELRITELMYHEGMGAQIDLINAQTANQQVRTEYLNAVRGMYAALVDLRKVVGDYSPSEDGTWREAVVRYGRGKKVENELASMDSTAGSAAVVHKVSKDGNIVKNKLKKR